MNRTLIRLLAPLAAVAVVALLVAGCGGGVPANSVARVGDNLISKTDFQHWMKVAATSAQQQQGGDASTTAVPQPPDYKACIAQTRKNLPKPAKGQPKVTDSQLKSQCAQQYKQLKDSVLQFLISSHWILGQADEMGIDATDAEVNKQFEQTEKQSFPKNTDKEFAKFLEQSGQTKADILFRVKLDVLSNKIREKVTKGKDQVSQAEIASYYKQNTDRFSQPERRDVRIVLTKTKSKAQEAKQALQSGGSWKDVAKQYSTDQASKNKGGKLVGIAKGTQEKALDQAMFSAKKGKLEGPVKTQFGYYVFEVTKVTPASKQTLEQASPTIKQILAAQGQQKALTSFVDDYQKKWKDKTTCRDGYVTQECKNAPKQKTTTGADTSQSGGTQTGGQTAPAQTTTTGGSK